MVQDEEQGQGQGQGQELAFVVAVALFVGTIEYFARLVPAPCV